jgi:hypothetical protein
MMETPNGGRIGKVKVKNGAEVVVLENRHTGNPVLIGMLIDLLDRARSDDLVALGVITVNPRGTVGTAWNSGGDGSHYHELASGALTLAHRMGGS